MSQEYDKEKINDLAWIAFIKMQLPPHRMRSGRATLSILLKEDPWWRSLDAVTHQQIGKIIKNNYAAFREKCPIEVYYRPFPDSVSEYFHDGDYKENGKEYIYHYTDIGAVLGIIGGKIRLSNSMIMNDKKESSYYLEHLIEEAEKRVSQQHIGTLGNLKNKYHILYETPTYLMSFTENEDDAAQWERYAYSGEGACIVFDKNALAIIAGKNGIKFDYVSYYRDYSYVKDVDELVNYVERGIKYTRASSEKELFDYFGCQSALFKHPSFRSEYEYRMYYSSQKYNRNPPTLKREVAYDGRIREFYEFDWLTYARKVGLSPVDVVDRVIIGPKAKVNRDILNRRIQDMSVMGKGSQWTGRIIDSDCPLR